jgi:D-alanyl-D-alanine carboxypeptidase (penicillin-binding protein 5/6)
MIKMMLMLMVAEGIEQGRWSLETPLTAGKNAMGVGGTGVDIQLGEVFTLDKLMSAIAVASANNAAMLVAEGLWGNQDAYVRCMNQRAQELGMTSSEFHSPHGLPPAPGRKVDMTTARDMAILARACTAHANVMSWVGLREIEFKPGFKKNTTNKLMAAMGSCDGLKTGFTNAAGFCISATAKRDNVRVVTVVMGFTGSRARFEMAHRLLEQGFTQVKRACVVAKGAPLGDPVPVLNSEGKRVMLTAGEDLWVTVRTEDMPRLQIRPECPLRLQAPLKSGAVVGQVNVLLAGKSLGQVPLTASENVGEARWRYKVRQAVAPRKG